MKCGLYLSALLYERSQRSKQGGLLTHPVANYWYRTCSEIVWETVVSSVQLFVDVLSSRPIAGAVAEKQTL